MSATSNNAGAGWDLPPVEGPPAGPGQAPGAGHDERNALQALLAFACIREQAAKRRALKSSGSLSETSRASSEEEFRLDEVLQLVAARAISITGADGVAIGLAEEDAIVCRASAGSIAPDPGIKLDPTSGFSGACLRSGQTVRCDDSDTDSRVNAQACRALGTRSMIAVPLSAKKRVVGLIEAFSTETFGFNDSDERSLNLLGELILAAIRPEEEDRLAELAEHIVVPETAPPLASRPSEAPAVTPHAPARIIVDEKFVPPVVVPSVVIPAIGVPPVVIPPHIASPARLEASAVAKPAIAIPALPDLLLNPKPAPIEAPGSLPKERRSVSGILITATLVLIVLGLGWAVVWKAKHVERSINASTRPIASPRKTDLNPTAAGQPQPVPPKAGALPEVTGIRHWSSENSSTVVVDLQDQVQYEEHTLDNPARIYFDLHDTKLAAGLLNQSIEVNDTFLKRIRMAQPTASMTRIVLETRQDSTPEVSLDTSPYRLTIELQKPAATVGVMASPATLSKPSPVVTVAPKKKTNESKVNESSLNPADFQIVLDAGHGGWDLGTVGKKGLLEKDLVLDIVRRLGKLIENKLGAQVIYTRQDDSYLPLEKRAEIANMAKASLFLSVHANYSDLSTARGVETYYTTTYSSIKARVVDDRPSLKDVNWTGVDIREKVTGSHRLASDVQRSLYGGLAVRNPDLRNRGVKEAQYVVLTGTQMPAVLAEVSFVSSPADEGQLQSSSYRQQIAEALYKGVAKYREEITHTKVASVQKTPRP